MLTELQIASKISHLSNVGEVGEKAIAGSEKTEEMGRHAQPNHSW